MSTKRPILEMAVFVGAFTALGFIGARLWGPSPEWISAVVIGAGMLGGYLIRRARTSAGVRDEHPCIG